MSEMDMREILDTEAVVERLRGCLETGEVATLYGVYSPDCVLDGYLPGLRVRRSGADAVLAELAEWWDSPAEVVDYQAQCVATGAMVIAERHPPDAGAASRHRHYVHVAGGAITRHIVYSERPRLVPAVAVPPARVEGVVHRAPLRTNRAFSGNILEQVDTTEGTFVVKHISRQWDWIMRATGDAGREAHLWRDGVFASLPPSIDAPVVRAVPHDDGWSIVMRDVTDTLPPPGSKLSHDQIRRLFAAASNLHRAFRQHPPEGLCTLGDRLRLLSPATVNREFEGDDVSPKVSQRIWELFADVAPDDIAAAVLSLHADPSPLVDRLLQRDRTLLHGDLKPGNIGFSGDRVVLLDWQAACEGPPAIDFVWFLNFTPFFDVPLDVLLDDIRAAGGTDHDEEALQLAIIFNMAMAASGHANYIDDPDEQARADEAAEFEWWIGATRAALDATGGLC